MAASLSQRRYVFSSNGPGHGRPASLVFGRGAQNGARILHGLRHRRDRTTVSRSLRPSVGVFPRFNAPSIQRSSQIQKYSLQVVFMPRRPGVTYGTVQPKILRPILVNPQEAECPVSKQFDQTCGSDSRRPNALYPWKQRQARLLPPLQVSVRNDVGNATQQPQEHALDH